MWTNGYGGIWLLWWIDCLLKRQWSRIQVNSGFVSHIPAPLRYEVEIRGYLPFRGVFDSIYYELYTKRLDIAGSHTFCNDEESLIRYMIAICVSFNHLKDDPRCPVHIDKDNHHQYYVLSKREILGKLQIHINREIPFEVLLLTICHHFRLFLLMVKMILPQCWIRLYYSPIELSSSYLEYTVGMWVILLAYQEYENTRI